MTKDEALRMALEALEELNNTNSYWWQEVDEQTTKKIEPAITAIKEALAQPEKDIPKIGCVNHDCDKCKAQPEQEPVAWQLLFDDGHTEITTRPVANWKRLMWESAGKRWNTLPLYTTPPQRTWVGLTEMEKAHMAGWYLAEQRPVKDLMHLVESKLKEKNA